MVSWDLGEIMQCNFMRTALPPRRAKSGLPATHYASCENCAIHLHNNPSRSVYVFQNWLLALKCDSGGDESEQSVLPPYPRPHQLAQVWQTAEKLISSHHSHWGSYWVWLGITHQVCWYYCLASQGTQQSWPSSLCLSSSDWDWHRSVTIHLNRFNSY